LLLIIIIIILVKCASVLQEEELNKKLSCSNVTHSKVSQAFKERKKLEMEYVQLRKMELRLLVNFEDVDFVDG